MTCSLASCISEWQLVLFGSVNFCHFTKEIRVNFHLFISKQQQSLGLLPFQMEVYRLSLHCSLSGAI